MDSASIEPAPSYRNDAVLDRLRESVALLLWELGAIKVADEEPFRLASGNFSPIYINCRLAISNPIVMGLFCTTALRVIERHELAFDVVAGGETAGIPFAAYLASALNRPLIYVRKKPKTYGIASRVEGVLKAGERLLLVEDLITDGGSKLGFLEAIQEAQGQVMEALVLFDRQQGGEELLARHGVRLHTVTDRTTALRVGEATGWVGPAARGSIEDYFADPTLWHQQRGLAFGTITSKD